MNINSIIAYIFNILIAVIGFFLVAAFNRNNTTLAQINRDVILINKEIVSLKIELTEMNSKMMTDERVKELIRLELIKR